MPPPPATATAVLPMVLLWPELPEPAWRSSNSCLEKSPPSICMAATGMQAAHPFISVLTRRPAHRVDHRPAFLQMVPPLPDVLSRKIHRRQRQGEAGIFENQRPVFGMRQVIPQMNT